MLHSSTFAFLTNLAAHNDKEWFAEHRSAYEAARGDFTRFVAALQEALTPLVPNLEAQPAKSLLFRTYRDVRFSKDKTPFKTHFSAYFSQAGRKAPDAGYYLHVRPGHCHFSAGMWEPQGTLMKAVRQEIDYSLEEWEGILKKPSFRKAFGELGGAVLRTVPQGYGAGHPAIAYLKHKSFIVSRSLPDAFFFRTDAVRKLNGLAREAAPLVAFLNRALEDA